MGSAAEKLTQRICETLEEERDALRTGKLDKLNRIMRAKEMLSKALEQNGHHLGNLQKSKLRTMSSQNAKLFEATLEGLRSSQNRMSQIENAQNGFNTYGSDGRVRPAGTMRNAIEKRT